MWVLLVAGLAVFATGAFCGLAFLGFCTLVGWVPAPYRDVNDSQSG